MKFSVFFDSYSKKISLIKSLHWKWLSIWANISTLGYIGFCPRMPSLSIICYQSLESRLIFRIILCLLSNRYSHRLFNFELTESSSLESLLNSIKMYPHFKKINFCLKCMNDWTSEWIMNRIEPKSQLGTDLVSHWLRSWSLSNLSIISLRIGNDLNGKQMSNKWIYEEMFAKFTNVLMSGTGICDSWRPRISRFCAIRRPWASAQVFSAPLPSTDPSLPLLANSCKISINSSKTRLEFKD